MKNPEKSSRVINGILFLLLLAITLLVYLPGIDQLGYYRDDWNNVFNAYTQGPDMLIQHYASDRPADGYLLSQAYAWFGPNPLPYLLINLSCRFLISYFFFLTLTRIWKHQVLPAFVAAALFLAFPGFLRQVDGISYLPHQIAMLCAMLSVFLSILSLEIKNMALRIVTILLSVLLASAEMLLMEYYIGIEGLRLMLIGCWVYNRSNQSFARIVLKSLIRFLPWLAGAVLFFVWRGFLFDATRAGTNVMDMIRPFLQHPKYYGLDWLSKIIRNTFKLIAGSWTIPVYNLVNGIGFKEFWIGVIKAVPAALLFLAAFLKLMPKRTGQSHSQSGDGVAPMPARKLSWHFQWIITGIIASVAAITPLVIATREITFSSSLDRFSYHASLAAIMLLIGLLSSIEGKWVKTTLFGTLMLAATLTQIINKENYIRQTQLTNDFWWQLSWRAPDISDGTLVLLKMAAFSPEEDYELFSPVHLIYNSERDHISVGSDLLNTETVRSVQMSITKDRKVREIYLMKDYSQILALTQPSSQSCLQTIDGQNPIYSPREWSRIPEIGASSQIDQILTDAEPHTPDSAIFGNEPQHGWCYFYQKIALAQQQESWEEVVRIGEEAIAAGTHGEDPVEWLPLVQAYAYSGRYDDAKPYGEILKTDDYLKFETCRYFQNAAEVLQNPDPAIKALPWLEAEFCDS